MRNSIERKPVQQEDSAPITIEGNLDEIFNTMPLQPEGWLRLTHVTDGPLAQELFIANQEGLDYSGRGVLSSTTDPFSDQKDVMHLVRTGTNDVFDRDAFGNAVLIIDMAPEEFKQRDGIKHDHKFVVSNTNILGVIETVQGEDLTARRKRFRDSQQGTSSEEAQVTYRLTLNPNYSPHITLAEKIGTGLRLERDEIDLAGAPIPFPTISPNETTSNDSLVF
jgi:hypothetical protein